MTQRRKLDAREAALLALQRVDDGAYANLALGEVFFGSAMDPRDKSLATEITYGVITYRPTLDWMIGHVCGRPVEKLDALILHVLRIAFYQLFYLDRVPAPAAVHSAVELVKRSKKRGLAPFVNGVLRGALRRKDLLPWPAREDDEAAWLALHYAHPLWLVRRWLARYGEQQTEALLRANNRPAPLTARTNTLRTDREGLLAFLAKEGVEAQPLETVPEGVHLKSGARLTELASYQQGMFQVQGESAMLTARILAPQPGERVLDGCSAPGGKTTHLAQLMDNSGSILALDIHQHRLELVNANCRRLGVDNVRTCCLDVREIGQDKFGLFDRVMLDVPCSGFGVIRRKPDLKWRRRLEDIGELSTVQQEMLFAALSVLKPGGTLLYSTCTNEPEETDEVVSRALREWAGLSTGDITGELPPEWKKDVGPYGIHLLPHLHGVDGFFISLLCKGKE